MMPRDGAALDSNTTETLAAALRYIARGWLIFPLHSVEEKNGKLVCTCGNEACTDSGKHPRTQRGLRDASNDPAKAREWFGPGAPPSNIAIVTGAKSGITVLDIDVGPGKAGAATWVELNREAGEPQTLVAKTGGGGMHYFFPYNSALPTGSNVLGPGVDVRNDKNGYIVAAPSRHRSGGIYEWENWGAELTDLPAHLTKRKETRGRKPANDPSKKKYTVEQVAAMLKFIKADDRDLWRNIGVILGREFNRAESAFHVYTQWSDKWGGQKGRGHDAIMREAFYKISQETSDSDLSLGTIVMRAIEGGWAPERGSVSVESFIYFAPTNNFLYRATGALWPAESADASCSMVNEGGTLVKASAWLKQNRLVTSMTNDPALSDEVTKDCDCREGAVIASPGGAIYNAYRRPTIELGDPAQAEPFVQHVRRVFNKDGDADQFLDVMAHRVQRPGEKVRFALLIAGEQGTGKDTAISMCRPAIGHWNCANIEPRDLDAAFNEHEAAVLVVVSEAANLQEMSRWALNEKLKTIIAGQPDFVTVNPKYGAKFSVRRHTAVIITSNHLQGGIYIPGDDRRYDVIAAATRAEMGLADPEVRAAYFADLWAWFNEGGASHVAAYLHQRDLSKFNPNSGQRRTAAHRLVVSSGLAGDESVTDALTELGDPDVVRMDELFAAMERRTPGEMTRKEFNGKAHHALIRAGYEKLFNANAADGRWLTKDAQGKRCNVSVYYRPDKIDQHAAAGRIHELHSF